MNHPTRHALLASLLLAAASLATPGAAHAGDVYFSRFNVADCNEIGTCDWKVNCWIGASQNAQQMIGNKEANSGESLEINRTIAFQQFPITVGCRVEEYDGGIGALWENLGVEQIQVNQTGPYTLNFEDNEDEGVASVEFTVTNTNSSSQGLNAAPAERYFLGVFRAGGDGHYLLAGIDRAKFDSEWTRLNKDGLRLTDMTTYTEGGKRRYAGIYRQGNDGYALLPGRDWATFGRDWTRASNEGLRLVDLETYVDNGKRRYTGVFRASTGGHYLTPALSWSAFTAKRDELAAQGLRLVDVETYETGSQRVYHGVFLPGNDGHFLWSVKGWKAFTDKWAELSKQNLRLVDVETYGSGANRQFVAVYRQGSDGYALYGAKSADFFKKWEELSKQGLRLVDLETYTE